MKSVCCKAQVIKEESSKVNRLMKAWRYICCKCGNVCRIERGNEENDKDIVVDYVHFIGVSIR